MDAERKEAQRLRRTQIERDAKIDGLRFALDWAEEQGVDTMHPDNPFAWIRNELHRMGEIEEPTRFPTVAERGTW